MVETAKKGWWGRNWTWCVPVGCLGMAVLAVALVAALVFGVTGLLRSSPPYTMALAEVEANAAAVEALGAPIRAGRFAGGNVSTSGPSGEANLTIPVTGSRARGRLHVAAIRSEGAWRLTSLVLDVRDGPQRMNLLPAAP